MEAPLGCEAPVPVDQPRPESPPPPPPATETLPDKVQDAEPSTNGHTPSTPNDDKTAETTVTTEPTTAKVKTDTYIGPLTTEEIIKVYDEKENSTLEAIPDIESILMDKVLGNLQCGDSELKSLESTAQNDNVKTSTTEDLLAILEGDSDKPASANPDAKSENKPKVSKGRPRTVQLNPELEKNLALKQLKELPSGKRKTPKTLNAILDVTIPSIKSSTSIKRYTIDPSVMSEKNDENSTPNDILQLNDSEKKNIKTYSKNKVNDISFIADDWSDDENVDKGEIVQKKAKCLNRISQNGIDKIDDSFVNPSEINSNQESLANRRVSRVIKKKIIWDPDNPESFKLASVTTTKKIDLEVKKVKNASEKSSHSENQKNKIKSPSIDNISLVKQNNTTPVSCKKRKMTEVDKLMMDEGVVNMMHELELSNNSDIPEKLIKKTIVPREKRNVVVKSKTVVSNVIKEKKVIRSKHNLPTNGVKMPKKTDRISIGSANEISDAIPDESRIIRRHSSSSFSSGCLSPRPTSPSEASATNVKHSESKEMKKSLKKLSTDSSSPSKQNDSGIKRKSYAGKIVSPKAKKLLNNNSKSIDQLDAVYVKEDVAKYSLLTMKNVDNCLYIEIKKHNTQGLFDTKMLKELTNAVKAANNENIRVLTLTSEDGMFCGGLNLHSVLHTRVNLQRTNAGEILEAVRELVMELCKFKGALIFGIDGPCAGFGVALLSLADLVLASDRATFCVAPTYRRQLPPEGVSLLNLNNFMSAQLSRELVYCGRKLTASEALHRGIIARTLWPDQFSQEIIDTAKDIAQYPQEAFTITKTVLRCENYVNIEKVLEDETLMLAEYWCSPSGQEAIRMTHSTA